MFGLTSSPAGATGTNLLGETFENSTTTSSDWVFPTGSAGVCLTAGTSTTATPIPDCDGTYGDVTEPIDANGSGALQLTNNGGSQVGTVYNGVAIPTSNGLDISWTSYQFDGTGADGISFDLAAVNPSDPTPPATTGPSGGSLGYSASGATPGVPYGYLGLGADVYGNFENSVFGGSGCDQTDSAEADSLGVRGPGNGTVGYCLLGKNQLTGGLTLGDTSATTRGSGSTSIGVPEEVVLNPTNSPIIASSSGASVPAGDWLFAVKPLSDDKAGTTWKTLEGALPTYPAGTNVPSTWINSATGLPKELAFGWAASTGGSNEFHQINQLQVASLTQSPSLGVTNTDSGGGVLTAGSNATVTLTTSVPSSSAVSESQPIIVSDTFSSSLVPTAASGTGWTCTVTSPEVSCSYTPSTAITAGTILPPITVSATASGSPGSFSDTATATSSDAAPATATDSGSIRGGQTITYTSSAPTTATIGGTYNVGATSTSELPVAITVDPSSSDVCSISGTTVTFNGSGACTLDANQSGNSSYAAATQVQQTFVVAPLPQTISFTSTPSSPEIAGSTYNVAATSTSGLGVSVSVDSSSAGVCSISGTTVTLSTGGVCTLDANQSGDAQYSAANQVQQSFAVVNTQTITFTSIAPATAQAAGTYTATATATSGLSVTFSSATPSVCSVSSGGAVSFTEAGVCTIDANQEGSGGFLAAPQVDQSFVIQAPNIVTFTTPAPPAAVSGESSYTPAADINADTSDPATITLDGASSGCSLTSGVVTFVSGGVCIIDATDGDVVSQQSFTVADTQTVSFTSTDLDATVGGSYNVTASATSGLTAAITVDGSSSSICSISGGTVTFDEGGVCVLDANQTGDSTYDAATQVQQALVIVYTPQTISFTSGIPGSVGVGGTAYDPTATATSSLPVAITVDPSSSSICSITAGAVTFQASGTCTLDANQEGNSTYAAAPQVQQSFDVAGIAQFITFTSTPPSSPHVGDTYNVTATSTSGLTVTISVDPSSSTVCTISGGTVTIVADGLCLLDANQAGNSTYPPATQATQALEVGPEATGPSVSQDISFTSTPPSVNKIGDTYSVSATSTSGLTVTISVDPSSSSVCTISGGTVTFIGNGTCVIDASQVGNDIYKAATQTSQSITVGGLLPQKIVFTSSAPSKPNIGDRYHPTATGGGSKKPVTFSVSTSSTSGCSYDASTGVVTFESPEGSCIIDANQAGSSTYEAATQAIQVIEVDAAPVTPLALTIYFANNSWSLTASTKSQLHAFAGQMKSKGLSNLRVVGFASSTGTSTGNNVLGIRRASTTAAYLKAVLVKIGVKKLTISIDGEGASNFVSYPSSSATNRRTSIQAT